MSSNAPVGAAPPYAYQKFERQQQRSTNISKSRWSWFWCLARCDYSSTNLSHEPCNCWFWSIATRPRGIGLGNRGSFGGLRTARAKYFPCAGGKYVSEIIHRLWVFFFCQPGISVPFQESPRCGLVNPTIPNHFMSLMKKEGLRTKNNNNNNKYCVKAVELSRIGHKRVGLGHMTYHMFFFLDEKKKVTLKLI